MPGWKKYLYRDLIPSKKNFNKGVFQEFNQKLGDNHMFNSYEDVYYSKNI
ncbi:hypothetical protein JCM14036_11110 [Desulfotomaculum defluvii]